MGIAYDSTTYNTSTIYERTGIQIWDAVDKLLVAWKNALGYTLGVDNIDDAFAFVYAKFGGTATYHRYDVVSGTAKGTYNGGFSHTGKGAIPNGINTYFQTGVNWTPSVFPRNTHGFGVNIKDSVSENAIDFGAFSGGQADALMYGRLANGNIATRCGGAAGNIQNSTTSSQQMKSINRTVSTQFKVFENGSLLATNTDGSSANTTSYEMIEFAGNVAGTIIQYSSKTHSIFYGQKIGFTDVQQIAIDNACIQFDTDLGR